MLELTPWYDANHQRIFSRRRLPMMRCERCKKITAVFALVCTCGGLFTAAVAEESAPHVLLFGRPDLPEDAHNHEEKGGPPMPARIDVAAVSTSTFSGSSDWTVIPSSITSFRRATLFWRNPGLNLNPPST
jgi:hypothetical protein